MYDGRVSTGVTWLSIRPTSRISQREGICWLLNYCELLNKNSDSWSLQLDNILEHLYIRDWTAGTHFLTFWAVSLLVSTMGHTATGVGSRLPVPDDMPPSYAESWLDSCGQCTATEITLLNQSNNLYTAYINKFVFTAKLTVTVFTLVKPIIWRTRNECLAGIFLCLCEDHGGWCSYCRCRARIKLFLRVTHFTYFKFRIKYCCTHHHFLTCFHILQVI
jgi:hypothetical protein